MSDSFAGHEMLNHLGEKIYVTARTMRTMDMRHYLRRDRASGLLQIKPELYPAYLELESGPQYHNRIFRELGADCSGAAVVICKCKQCQWRRAEMDQTRLPGPDFLEQDEASRIVREVVDRRPAA